jgi:hypothetical protein
MTHRVYIERIGGSRWQLCRLRETLRKGLEARVGIEPTHKARAPFVHPRRPDAADHFTSVSLYTDSMLFAPPVVP